MDGSVRIHVMGTKQAIRLFDTGLTRTRNEERSYETIRRDETYQFWTRAWFAVFPLHNLNARSHRVSARAAPQMWLSSNRARTREAIATKATNVGVLSRKDFENLTCRAEKQRGWVSYRYNSKLRGTSEQCMWQPSTLILNIHDIYAKTGCGTVPRFMCLVHRSNGVPQQGESIHAEQSHISLNVHESTVEEPNQHGKGISYIHSKAPDRERC